jgi:uncharacterized membrane protein YbhN (UPF0104 family)
MPWFLFTWVLWSIGFYLLALSITKVEVPWYVAFAFPLAAVFGIITFLTPGGVGTREGVLIAYMTVAGIPIIEATIVAVASRFWFLIGEAFIFVVGWGASRRNAANKTGYQTGDL